MAGGNKRQRKSSFSFSLLFVFNLFKSKKGNKRRECDHVCACDACRRVWPSDEDKGRWGVAEPGIDKKAENFIASRKSRSCCEPST